VLADQLSQGFALRATWTGSEVRHEREVTVNELADLALTSQLNEFTRYRLPRQNPTGSSALLATAAQLFLIRLRLTDPTAAGQP
jgi:hypothetical protein